jgi:hypothetical protein
MVLIPAGTFTMASRMAAGIRALRAALTPEIMQDIMALQGSSLGFRTDKDKEGGYPVEVVKECMIEAVLKGARVINNETNIIASLGGYSDTSVVRVESASGLVSFDQLEELSGCDLAYAPPFGPVWDPLLTAANKLLKMM